MASTKKQIDDIVNEDEKEYSSYGGPTKRNRADQQQPYVPAGNGDESGEYADADGANVHYGGNKQNDNNEVEKTKDEKNDNISVVKDKPNGSNSFEDYINQHYGNTDFGNSLKENFDVGTDDAKGIINLLVKNGVHIKQTNGISNYSGAVNLSGISKFGDYSAKVKGETFYHEFWHAADNYFCEGQVGENGEITLKSLRTEEDTKHIVDSLGGGWSAVVDGALLTRDLSSCKVLSNGKTLYETLQKECATITRTKDADKNDGWRSMIKDYKNEVLTEFRKQYPDYEEKYKQYSDIVSQISDESYRLYPTDWTVSSEERNKTRELRNQYEKTELEKRLPNVKEYLEKADMERHKIEIQLQRSWMSISDMYGIYRKVPYGFCGGHAGNYGSKLKGAIAKEFMAEFGSARSRTDEHAKKELELFNKYFPETSKMCVELQDMVINHCKKGAK